MAAGRSQRAALELIGLSKSSFHYRSKPRAPVAVPVLHRGRHQPAALSQHERDQVCQLLAQGAREGLSIEQIHLRHVDSGPVLASSATFHRLASQRGSPVLVRPVRARRARTSTVPQLMAAGGKVGQERSDRGTRKRRPKVFGGTGPIALADGLVPVEPGRIIRRTAGKKGGRPARAGPWSAAVPADQDLQPAAGRPRVGFRASEEHHQP